MARVLKLKIAKFLNFNDSQFYKDEGNNSNSCFVYICIALNKYALAIVYTSDSYVLTIL